MKRSVRIFLLCMSLLFCGALLLVAVRWDNFVQQQLRPRLVTLLAEWLEADVELQKMQLGSDSLILEGVRLPLASGTLLQVPRIEARFELGELAAKKLKSLRLERPRLRVVSSNTDEDAAPLPLASPLTIENLSLVDGSAELLLPDRVLAITDLGFDGSLGTQLSYRLSARTGPRNELLELAGSGRWQQGMSFKLDSLRFNRQQLLSRSLQLRLTEDVPTVSAGLKFEGVDDQLLRRLLPLAAPRLQLPGPLHFQAAELQLQLERTSGQLSLGLRLPQLQLGWQERRLELSGLSLDITPTEQGWRAVGRWQLPGEGSAEGVALFGPDGGTADLNLDLPVVEPLLRSLDPALAGQLRGGLRAGIKLSFSPRDWQLETEFNGRRQSPAEPGYFLNLAEVSGQLSLRTDSAGWRLALESRLAKQPLLEVTGTPQQLRLKLLKQQRSTLQRLLNPALLPQALSSLEDLTADANLSRDAGDSWHLAGKIRSRSLVFSNIQLLGPAGEGRLRYRDGRLDIEFASLQSGLRGVGFSARLQLAGKGHWQQGRGQFQLRDLVLDEGEYASADGLSGVAGLRLQLGPGSIAGDRENLYFSLPGTLVPGELLHGSFYADLSDLTADLQFQGQYAAQQLQLEELRLELPGLLKLTSSGNLSARQGQLSGDLRVADAGRLLAEAQTRLEDQMPQAFRGMASGQLDLSWTGTLDPDGWWLQGMLRPQQLDFKQTVGGLTIAGLKGELPLLLRSGSPRLLPVETAVNGQLELARLQSSPVAGSELSWRLESLPNRLRWLNPLQLSVAGGELRLNGIDLGWEGFKPDLSGRVQVTDVDLETLTRTLGWPEMQGTLRADLGTLRYRDDNLQIDGTASIDIFGGHIRVGNMQLAAPLSPYPSFLADIDFEKIDLFQATRTFEFGEMNGVIDGYIHELRLFGATPSKFRASLESRSEGRRNISVKAINNLNTLSQGGLSSALSQGIYQFIDFYRYRKIGISCYLENDLFHLRGTASPGSERVLIASGFLPPRIEMTVSSPTIPFREMVKRLKRIDRAGK